MRVIAGTARRLLLKTVDSQDIRPTTDRIKETLFNILANDLHDTNFLDLFAGSGAMGIEALSRGAKKAVFIERESKALACIRHNLLHTKLDSRADIIAADALSGLIRLENRGSDCFHIVFMDPPYEKGLEVDCLNFLKTSNLINQDSIVIVECSKYTDIEENYYDNKAWDLLRIKEYKSNRHIFLRRRNIW